jgi:hypothetical protein
VSGPLVASFALVKVLLPPLLLLLFFVALQVAHRTSRSHGTPHTVAPQVVHLRGLAKRSPSSSACRDISVHNIPSAKIVKYGMFCQQGHSNTTHSVRRDISVTQNAGSNGCYSTKSSGRERILQYKINRSKDYSAGQHVQSAGIYSDTTYSVSGDTTVQNIQEVTVVTMQNIQRATRGCSEQ